MVSRIVERHEELDYRKVREFFARRSRRIKELGSLSMTMFQDDDLARRRDTYEKEVVLPLFGGLDYSRVLDIGCGAGRWGNELATKVAVYLGIDFCQAYVDAAQAKFVSAGLPRATHTFQQLAAQQVSAATLAISPPYDIVIIAGLMMYLNDEDAIALLSTIPQLTHEGSLIYIREPIGVEHRLTLKEHFSEELGEYYHAIYRKAAEYESFFTEALPGFTLVLSRTLFPDELCNRKETAQHIFFIRAPKHSEDE